MKRFIAVICMVLAIALLASCAAPAPNEPGDSIFKEIKVNKNKTHVEGFKQGMSVAKVLKRLGLTEDECNIETRTMDNYNPPLEYTQLETPAIYVYGENTDLTFTKSFYFQNGKLIFMLYHCNSEGEDYDWFYENALLFMSKFIDGSGAEAVGEESKDFGYTVSGYFKRASFDTQGAYYRIIYQNSGALNEIGLASYQSNLSASSSGELALSLSIELSF